MTSPTGASGASFGYFLSSEEFSPDELIEQAQLAERAGFERLWLSDHFHPWNNEQGESAFVWSMLGALSRVTSLPITTAVTCPLIRIHPAVIAQAAATTAVLTGGKFILGIGTGEALNEHILGDRWPAPEVRLEMLEEAVELMREMWKGGSTDHWGKHYTVENARIYTRPDAPPPIYISGFGEKAATLAGRIGDGFMCTEPNADLVQTFREAGGGSKPAQAGVKVCWGEDEDAAVALRHKLWPNESLPGQLAQDLPTPTHFEQACELVTPEMIKEATVNGNDVDRHVELLGQYVEAGFDEVYVNQIGPDQEGFFRFYAEEVLPRVRS